MEITKNFLFFICITTIFRTIAMEEFTPQDKKKLRTSLEALSLEIPKYKINPEYPINNARQNFNTLMGVFCSTKGDTNYNFLNVLRIEQEDLVKEIHKLKMEKKAFNLDCLAQNQNLEQKQESLRVSQNNVDQIIIEAKKELGKLETLKQEQTDIENLKVAHQNELNILKDGYKAKLNAHHLASEERYAQECTAFKNKIIDDNQKSLTAIIDKRKAEFEAEYEDLKAQLRTKYQNEKAALENDYQTKKTELEFKCTTLMEENTTLLSQQKTNLEDQYKKANQLSLLQRYPTATLVSGLFFGGLTTFLSMRYNIANSSLESITSLAGKLFNKTH